jgi:uncharacterized cupin superfamily protein
MTTYAGHQLADGFSGWEVLTPLFASSCGASIVRVAPGNSVPHQEFSTEHVLVHLTGDLSLDLCDAEYALEPHDMVFVPAFTGFLITNTGEIWAEYLSCNLKKDEWPGRRFLADGTVVAMPLRSTPDG